jgi:hypothetical protein
MNCAILNTRCRLCGVLFEEPLCVDARGSAWKHTTSPSPEDGNAWCPVCMSRINEACETLCVGVGLGSEEADWAADPNYSHP